MVPEWAQTSTGDALEWNAAEADQVSGPLPAVGHGAFTYFAIGALRGWADGELDGTKDGEVTAKEAQMYVQRALGTLQKVTQQTPVLVGDRQTPWVLSRGVHESGPELDALTAADLRANNARFNRPLLLGSGAAGVIAGASFAMALSARLAFDDPDTPYGELDALQTKANTFGVVAAGTGVVALGLGTSAFFLSTRW